MPVSHPKPLGNKPPPDDRHVRRYAVGPVRAQVLIPPEEVDRRLRRGLSLGLPRWHWSHDQGHVGACVGFAVSMERAISNAGQLKLGGVRLWGRRYDPVHIWNEAKLIDEWPDTNPGDTDGTSARAAYDVMRDQGPRRVKRMIVRPDGWPEPVGAGDPDQLEGVVTNRWATTVDEIRASIASGVPVCIGTPWFARWDRPEERVGRFGRKTYWLTESPEAAGSLRGYHETVLYGASDETDSFDMKNSWGRSFPLAKVSYYLMERLLSGNYWTDAALVVDR